MANEEQVKRLLADVEGWNKWREENPDIAIDLEVADLEGANLSGAFLQGANLEAAGLKKAILYKANLRNANLLNAELGGANLEKARLRGAFLWNAILREANLKETELLATNLCGVDLKNADLYQAHFDRTVLGDIDLSETNGLEDVRHHFPSIIGTSTLQLSKGKIPEKFLRGCGLSDWEIESAKLYQPELSKQEIDNILKRINEIRVGQGVQINRLFISHSHKDSEFVDEIGKHLTEKGIRFWRDIHDATSGRLEKIVDQAIRQNPIELLILSENSVRSDWVEHEVRVARELEKELGRDVLCPVALDDAWKDCKWSARLREQIMEYNILDFSKWKDNAEFAKMFQKLIDGLDLFYKE